jgi:signal peptide peptidase SppA
MEMDFGSAPRYRHVVEAVFRQPWAILPEKLAAIAELVQMRVDGFRLDPQAVAEIAAAGGKARPQRSNGLTAVLPLHGTLLWRVGAMEEMSGATSLQRFGQAFDAAMNDDRVKSIVIDVDSPGGQVDGVPETAAKIFSARGRKPVTAVVNTMGASAAYWLAAAAEELVISPSGMAGSVGVYMMHQDISEAAAAAGVRVTFIEAPEGGHKTEGNEFAPLADSAREHAQGIVNELYGMFVSDLARFRGVTEHTVRESFGKGQVFLAKETVTRRMTDRVVTFEEVLGRHGGAQNAVLPASAEDAAPAVNADAARWTERQARVQFEIARQMRVSRPAGASDPEEEVA